MSQVLNQLADIYEERDDFDHAIEIYNESLKIMQDLGDREGVAHTLTSLANAYVDMDQGHENDALALYEKSLEIWRELDDRHGITTVLSSLGHLHDNLRHFKEALECYEQDLSLSRKLGDGYRTAQALMSLGLVHTRLKMLDEAIGELEEGLAIMQDVRHRQGEVSVLGLLGCAYAMKGQTSAAKSSWQQALDKSDRGSSDYAAMSNFLRMAALVPADRLPEALTKHLQL